VERGAQGIDFGLNRTGKGGGATPSELWPSMAMGGGRGLDCIKGSDYLERKRKGEKMRGDGRGLITPLNADLKEGKAKGRRDSTGGRSLM
jgi:hypothetical protein